MARWTISREPSRAANAKQFDPDLLPWEKQPDETDAAYDAFRKFRDMMDRSLDKVATGAEGAPSFGTVGNWSSQWSWGWRAYQWDLHSARQEDEQMLRYQIEMNKRHRETAQLAVTKVAQWLIGMQPETLKPADAARWFEVAVRVQREAAGLGLMAAERMQGEDGQPEGSEGHDGQSLADVFGLEGMDADEAAAVLYRAAAQNGSLKAAQNGHG